MNIIKWLTNRKYRFFYKKVRDVTASIWEYEFKVAKSRQIREGVRQDRDRVLEAVAQIDARIKGLTDLGQIKLLNEQKGTFLLDSARYEAQIKMIDDQVSGVAAQGEDPGVQGIMDTIGGLAELRVMYKDYISRL